MAYSPAFFAVQ